MIEQPSPIHTPTASQRSKSVRKISGENISKLTQFLVILLIALGNGGNTFMQLHIFNNKFEIIK